MDGFRDQGLDEGEAGVKSHSQFSDLGKGKTIFPLTKTGTPRGGAGFECELEEPRDVQVEVSMGQMWTRKWELHFTTFWENDFHSFTSLCVKQTVLPSPFHHHEVT